MKPVPYTFGTALDHPLAVHRFDFRDSTFTKYDTSMAEPLNMQPLTIYPHTNWRGDYHMGTFETGERQRCVRVPITQGDHETVDGYVPGNYQDHDNPNGQVSGSYEHCLAAAN